MRTALGKGLFTAVLVLLGGLAAVPAWAEAAFGPGPVGLDVQTAWGSYRTPYWYAMSEVEVSGPLTRVGGLDFRARARARAWGSFYFFNGRSMDTQFSLFAAFKAAPGLSFFQGLTYEIDLRLTNDVRAFVNPSFAPGLVTEASCEGEWTELALSAQEFLHSDGAMLRQTLQPGLRLGNVTVFVKLEASELLLWTGDSEVRWESLAGVKYRF